MSPPQKIGGEYGEVRANIDVEKLNAYLAKHTPGIKGPVDVKQFKVCSSQQRCLNEILTTLAFSSVRYEPNLLIFSVSTSNLSDPQSNPTYFLTDAK